MTFKIEKNIPLPNKGGRGRPLMYPFDQMDVNDSFLIPKGVNAKSVSNAAGKYGKRHGKEFTTREIGNGRYRIWRTS